MNTRPVRRIVAALALLILASCKSSSSPSPAPEQPPAPAPARAEDAAAPRIDASHLAPMRAAIAGRGDACSKDQDCNWDDACMPKRCAATPRQPRNCDESAPPPGTCTCVESQCTLRPDKPETRVSDAGCTRDDECAIDVGGAACVLRGDTLVGPITREGPLCTCDAASKRCRWSYVAPIACTTWRDCSWVTKPRLRPAPATLVPRPVAQPVRACKDGEVDSVCKDKVCTIVGWTC